MNMLLFLKSPIDTEMINLINTFLQFAMGKTQLFVIYEKPNVFIDFSFYLREFLFVSIGASLQPHKAWE